jgi:hypothetical protein
MTGVPEASDTESISRAADKMECLLVVGGYDQNARVLGEVVAEARKRVMTSPLLDDFFELRFVDIGSRPEGPGLQAPALARLTHELAHPRDGAARYYFAFVVIDKSAAAVERVLRDCSSDSVLSALPIRFCGVATVDDRRPDGDAPDAAGAEAEIVLPEAGTWGADGLITQILRYAGTLLDDFASGQEPGLPHEGLDDLQRASAAALDAAAAAGSTPETGTPVRADDKDAGRRERQPALDEPRGYPTAGQLRPGVPGTAVVLSGAPRPGEARPGKTLRTSIARAVRFVLRGIARVARLGSASRAGTPRAELTARAADSAQLALLVPVSHPGTSDARARDRVETVFHEVERDLAVSGAHWVHTIWDADGAAVERLRPAGRHVQEAGDSKPAGLDFARAVEAARTVLARDVTALEGSSWTVVSSAVVFYAQDVPLADPRTVQTFGDIVQNPGVRVAWVVPKGTADLIAPQLRRHVRVMEAHRRVAEEITSFLLDPARSSPPDPRSSREPAP